MVTTKQDILFELNYSASQNVANKNNIRTF